MNPTLAEWLELRTKNADLWVENLLALAGGDSDEVLELTVRELAQHTVGATNEFLRDLVNRGY